MIPDLPPAFKRSLMIKAHALKSILRLGAKGLSPHFAHEVDQALQAHELIKIKLTALDPQARLVLINDLATTHNAHLIQRIGHIVVLYRKKTQPMAK